SDYQRVAIGKRIQTSNYVAAAGDCRDLGFVGEEHVHFGQSIDQIPRPFFGGIVSAVERCSEAGAACSGKQVRQTTPQSFLQKIRGDMKMAVAGKDSVRQVRGGQ